MDTLPTDLEANAEDLWHASLVEFKLLYSLVSLVFTVAHWRKINGFPNRCLRRIIGVLPAYVSQVSNANVLARTSYTLATDLLLTKRLQLFGKILRSEVIAETVSVFGSLEAARTLAMQKECWNRALSEKLGY